MRTKFLLFILSELLGIIFFTTVSIGQNSSHYGGGLKLNLGDNPEQYIRFLLWNQAWARSNENNPGTMVKNKEEKNTMDVGIRSARLLAYAQLSSRYLIVFHLGINNQTFLNGGATGSSGTGSYGAGKKPQIFFHEAYNEFAIVPNTDKDHKKTFSLCRWAPACITGTAFPVSPQLLPSRT